MTDRFGVAGDAALTPPHRTVIDSWQTSSSDDGWIDWGNGLSITDAANTGVYSFVSGAVLATVKVFRLTRSGNHQNLAIS